MGFGKAFGAGIALFLGINVALTFLVGLLYGIQDADMLKYINILIGGMNTDILGWILALLGGMVYVISTPTLLIGSIASTQLADLGSAINTNFLSSYIFAALGWIIVIALMFVVAIVVGYLSHSPGVGFGAMFLIVTIGAVIGVIGIFLYNSAALTAFAGSPFYFITYSSYSTQLDLWTIVQGIIVPIVITSVVNGLILGGVAMAMGYKYEE